MHTNYSSVHDFPYAEQRPIIKPNLGKVKAEINPLFNNKAIYRRILLQKQSELMRKHQKRGGVMKSINDVIKLANQEEKQDRRDELLQ